MEAAANFVIRPARDADIPVILPLVQKICDMHRSMDPERYPFLDDVAERYRGWLKTRATDSDSVLLVADSNSTIAGFIVGEILDEIPVFTLKRYAFLHDLWVEPEFRRHGIAKQLLLAAIDAFAQRGITQIRGDALFNNHTSQKMLQAIGFRPSTILMVKDIKSAGS